MISQQGAKAINQRMWDTTKQISQFYDAAHNTSMGRIDGTEDAICETTEEMESRFADIEDAICELSEK